MEFDWWYMDNGEWQTETGGREVNLDDWQAEFGIQVLDGSYSAKGDREKMTTGKGSFVNEGNDGKKKKQNPKTQC